MAGFANIAGTNMRDGFSGSNHVVMTTDTSVEDTVVRKLTTQLPLLGWRIMAGIAFRIGGNMRGGLAYCNCIIVAGRACTLYLRMIDTIVRDFPVGTRAMAFPATITTGDMPVRFAGSVNAIVATDAITGIDAGMIERGFVPRFWRRLVTQIAFIVGLDMFRPFTNGDRVVVATRTRADHLAVIDEYDRRK